MAKKSTSPGSVRIISGKWRSRKLPVANVDGLRPTTDRVRETLFNWLQHSLIESRCLDLFAGTGALGFEAASRGAACVQMIERDRKVIAGLQQSAELLNADQIKILQTDGLNWLEKGGHEPFDIIFLDPPFDQHLLAKCLKGLSTSGCLKSGSLLYLEQASKVDAELDLDGLESLKQAKAGDVRYSLLKCL